MNSYSIYYITYKTACQWFATFYFLLFWYKITLEFQTLTTNPANRWHMEPETGVTFWKIVEIAVAFSGIAVLLCFLWPETKYGRRRGRFWHFFHRQPPPLDN